MKNHIKIFIMILAAAAFFSCSKKTVEDVSKRIDTTSKTLGHDVDTIVSNIDTAVQKIIGGDSLFNKVNIKDVDESKLADKDFRKNLNDIFAQYTDIKDELVDDDSIGVNKQAKELKESLVKVQNGGASQPSEGKWKVWMSSTEKLASELESRKSLNEQRSSFKELSSSMETLIRNYGLSNTTVYKLDCPKTRSFWLTKSKDSKNPFYGKNKQETQCANVVEAWKFD